MSLNNFGEEFYYHSLAARCISPNITHHHYVLDDATKISTLYLFMQTLDSNKQASREQLHFRTLDQGISLRKHHNFNLNHLDHPHSVKRSGNLDQNHVIKAEGIPDPESYLEDVVLALAATRYPSHVEEIHEQKRRNYKPHFPNLGMKENSEGIRKPHIARAFQDFQEYKQSTSRYCNSLQYIIWRPYVDPR